MGTYDVDNSHKVSRFTRKFCFHQKSRSNFVVVARPRNDGSKLPERPVDPISLHMLGRTRGNCYKALAFVGVSIGKIEVFNFSSA